MFQFQLSPPFSSDFVFFLFSVKDSLLAFFSDTESESIASSNEDADSLRRTPSPQPGSNSVHLSPLFEDFFPNMSSSGSAGKKRPEVTQGELHDRFKKMVSDAVDFVLYTGTGTQLFCGFLPHLDVFQINWKLDCQHGCQFVKLPCSSAE